MDDTAGTADSGLLLSAEDIRGLKDTLCRAQAKWYELGTKLGFSSAALHEIEKERRANAGDGSTYMSAMLDGWAKAADPPLPTWSHLIKCLQEVEECNVAKAVEELVPKVVGKETQKAAIEPLLRYQLVKGETWYLVHAEWLKSWKRFVNFDYYSFSAPNPGPINTADLLKDDQLKEFLMEGSDFALLPQLAWEKMVSWYGLSQGSIPIPRKVAEYGIHVKELKVEIYLTELHLCFENQEPITRVLSRSTTVGELEALMRDIFQVPKDTKCVLSSFYRDLKKPDETLGELSIHSREKISLRHRSQSDSSPEQSPPESRPSQAAEASNVPKQSDAGLCGLNNLGNTCFMNSALQCLSNTEPLRSYFLATNDKGERLFEKDVNIKNPLGSGGAIARAFSKLMEEMWRGGRTSVAPRQLKSEVGDFAPQFSGYGQQDSQELLAFLLDGLHEDLNLVQNKPYVDMTMKTEGRSDKEIANETWEKYLMRNRSFIVDHFQGQYRSTVTCPQCNMVSKTFDPFMYLSLSVPLNSEMVVLPVTVVRADPSTPVCKYKLKVIKQGTMSDLKMEVQNVTKINQSMMVAVGVERGVIEKIFGDAFILTDLADKEDIYIYELTHPVDDPNYVTVTVQHHEERVVSVRHTYKDYQKQEFVPFGFPLVIEVPKVECTFANLYSIIESRCRFIKSYTVDATDHKGCKDDPISSEETADQGYNQNDVIDSAEENQSRKSVEMLDVVRTKSRGSIERPACLFRLEVGNRKGKKTKQEELSDNGRTVELNSSSFVACIWKPQIKKDFYDNVLAMHRDECAGSSGVDGSGLKGCELIDCFRSFSTTRPLSEDNKWNCPKCKKVRATKKFDIWKWPRILIVHFKRFSYGKYRRSKIEGLITFPIKDCNLSEFNINPEEPTPTYDLFAVSNHFGGMGGGHYTAYAKNTNTGNWYLFNDSSVEQVSESRIVSSAAYVLFYCHKTKGTPKETAV